MQTIGIGSARSDFVLDWEGSRPWLACLNARWPRHQIYNSFQAVKAASQSKGLFVPRHLFVVRNGVDCEYFRMVPLRQKARPIIAGIGSLIPVKRWDRLLSAASELKRRNCEFSVRIAGDGPLRSLLEQEVQNRGLEGTVDFFGHVNNVPEFLSDATLLVHCSDAEGCPNAVMEAMACGRAVVATDVGDTPSLIENEKTGFVINRGDDTTLVERINTLIVDRELCQRMGEAGRAKAETEFTTKRLVLRTLAAYRAAGWNDVRGQENSCHYTAELSA
jgi:glycosyltransferase involved in cell wall biosynthesis